MKHALEILEKELVKLQTPDYKIGVDDDEDIYSAVGSMRQTSDIKLALKYLYQIKNNTEELMKISYLWK